ncbi:MAG: hypothetical protein J7639_28190, partial [Paenibacillaceae bacterium]|nr:hypothetical protein [Paenibacillaceae bacterium]
GTTDLLRDRDYAVTPTAIILKKAYLAGLAVGSTTLTVDFPGLIGQSLLVNVTDTSSTVAPSRVGFSRRNAAQQDITVTLQAYGDAQLLGIYNGEVQLQHNVDYALSGHTVTLKKAYLSTLQGKAVALTFRMSSGNDPNVTIYPVSDEPTDAVLSSLATGVSGMDVKLSGTISTGANRRVTEIVSDPNGVPVYIGQSVSGTGGSFELTFTASRLLTGTYTVKVGGEQVSDPQTITFAY